MIYIDQTTLIVKGQELKTWQRKDIRLEMPTNTRQLKSVTIYAGISNFLPRPILMVASSTNSKNLVEFLNLIKTRNRVNMQTSPLVVCLDL